MATNNLYDAFLSNFVDEEEDTTEELLQQTPIVEQVAAEGNKAAATLDSIMNGSFFSDVPADPEGIVAEDAPIDTGPSTPEIFLERMIDSPMSRLFTRPSRDAITIAGSALRGELPAADELLTNKPFMFGGQSLPDDELTSSQLVAGVLGDILGDTISTSIIAQQIFSRYGQQIAGPAGRRMTTVAKPVAAVAGGVAGAAKGTYKYFSQKVLARKLEEQTPQLVEAASASANRQTLGMLTEDFVRTLSTQAQERPLLFVAEELLPFTTAASFGIAAGLGTDPSDRESVVQNTERGALVGSILSPVTIGKALASAGVNVARKTKNFLGKIGQSGKDNPVIRKEAAELLTRVAAEEGITIDDALRAINSSLESIAEVDPALAELASQLPVGSLTDNPFLVGLQRQASRRSPKSAATDELNVNQYFEGLAALEQTLRASGDPQALALAAGIRKDYFRTLLDARLERAKEDALSKLINVSRTVDAPGADPSDIRRGASKQAFETTRAALREARTVENALYDAAGDGVLLNTDQLAPAANALARAQVELKEFYADLPLTSVVERIVSEGESVPFIRRTTSRLLAEARRLESQGKIDEAQSVREFLLSPLKNVLETVNIPELKMAQEYSAVLSEAFTKSVVNRFISRDNRGAYRVDPEAMLGALLRGGDDEAAIRLDRFIYANTFGDRATQFRKRMGDNFSNRRALLEAVEDNNELLGEVSAQQLQETVLGFDTGFGTAVMRETDMYLRALTREFTDPETKQVDVKALVGFVNNNRTILRKFPDLEAELSDVVSAATRIKRVERSNKNLSSPTMTRRLFGGLINSPNPTPVLQRTLISPNRTEQLRAMAGAAKRAEEGIGETAPLVGALRGMQTAVLDAAYTNAKTGNNFSWSRYQSILTSPPVGGGSSVIDDLLEFGVMDREQADRLLEVVNLGALVEGAAKNPAELDRILFAEGKTNAILNAVVGFGGVAAGSAAQKTVGNVLGTGNIGSIQIPGYGATLFRSLFLKRGRDEVHDLIMEATSNASLFKALFEEFDPNNLKEVENAWNGLNLQMAIAGLYVAEDDDFSSAFNEEFELPEIPDIQLEEEEQPFYEDLETDFFDQLR